MEVSLTEAIELTRRARTLIQPLVDDARRELAGPDPDVPWSAGVFSTDHMESVEVWKQILQQYREIEARLAGLQLWITQLADRPDQKLAPSPAKSPRRTCGRPPESK